MKKGLTRLIEKRAAVRILQDAGVRLDDGILLHNLETVVELGGREYVDVREVIAHAFAWGTPVALRARRALDQGVHLISVSLAEVERMRLKLALAVRDADRDLYG